MTTSTSGNALIYISQVTGPAGIIGISYTPSLLARINAIGSSIVVSDLSDISTIIYGRSINSEIDGGLSGVIRVRTEAHTINAQSSGGIIYTGEVPGGVGILGILSTPDLLASIIPNTDKTISGSSDLNAIIEGIVKGSVDLVGYIRTAESGVLDLGATISGNFIKDILGYIIPVRSGSLELPTFIEPIPPVDLEATIQPFTYEYLLASTSAIEPADLIGTVYGQFYIPLFGRIDGYDQECISGSISGAFLEDIYGNIYGYTSDSSAVSGIVNGIRYSASGDLPGYITGTFTESGTVSGYIKGDTYKDVDATIYPVETSSGDITAVVSGDENEILHGTITPTGSLGDIQGYIHPTSRDSLSISGVIIPDIHSDLFAEINISIGDTLLGNITPKGPYGTSSLSGGIIGESYSDIGAQYTSNIENILNGNIYGELPSSLYAVITPKVFFIDSTIPINTYPFANLRAVINASSCGFDSLYQDLQVSIYGIAANKLEASIIGVAGQYALTGNDIEILIKQAVAVENWMFLITKSPVIVDSSMELIFTNSPLSDLVASITAVPNSADLAASVSPAYFPTVYREGVPIGEWVNTETGETKLIKIYFKGSVSSFYYSSIAHKTYAESPFDSLDIEVETYRRTSGEQGLLTQKVKSHTHTLKNLQEFPSIDEAIKFGILMAASEMYSSLGAYIEARGYAEDISATISAPIPGRYKDIKCELIAVEDSPDLEATIVPAGGFKDVSASIESNNLISYSTYSIFFDTTNNSYVPILGAETQLGRQILLTKLAEGDILNIAASPDVIALIRGVDSEDVTVTISGTT